MQHFRYRAVTASGKILNGSMEADSKESVVRRLQEQGHIPIRAEALSARAANRGNGSFRLGRAGPASRWLAVMTRQLATLLRAGLPLDRALQIIATLFPGTRERVPVEKVLEAVESGAALADALAAQESLFPRFYISMVRAGEAGASLDTVLERLADFLERSRAAREKIKSALIYPTIVAVTCILSISGLLAFVVPRFEPLFAEAGANIPASTRMVLAVSHAARDDGWIGLPVLLLALAGVLRLRQSRAARAWWDRLVLRLPLFGDLIRKIEAARFSRTFGTLLRNGVPILTALVITRQTIGNSVIGAAIQPVIESVKEGRSLSEPLDAARVFPPLAIHLIRVGEETGRQEEMLLKTAEIFDQETDRTIERLLTLVGPAMTVILGTAVAVVISSILTAVLGVYELAQ